MARSLWIGTWLLLLAFLALPAAGRQEGPQVPDELAALDSPDGARRRAAIEFLAGAGPGTLTQALTGFEGAALSGRRARAELLRRAGGAEHLQRAATWLPDPDREVSLSLIAYLGRPDLGEEAAPERVRALVRVAHEATEAELRTAALGALGRMPGRDPIAALDGLFAVLSCEDQVEVARILAASSAARRDLVARVRAAFEAPQAGRSVPCDAALVELFGAYGTALADLPAGGASAADLAPILIGSRHPTPEVERAAGGALTDLLDRLVQLLQPERLAQVLDLIEELGWDPRDVNYRRAIFALARGDDPGPALEAARLLIAAPILSEIPEQRLWHFYGHYLEAAGLLASGRPTEATEPLARAAALADALHRTRLDLRPTPFAADPEFARLDAEVATRRALVELLAATCRLAASPDAVVDLEVLEHLRLAHEIQLAAQARAQRNDAPVVLDSVDALLSQDLAPLRLVLLNPASRTIARERQLELQLALARALRTVAPWEMPGFEPLPGVPARLADPLADPARLRLLREGFEGQLEDLRRQRERFEDLRQEERDEGLRELLANNIAIIRKRESELQWKLAGWEEPDYDGGYPELIELRWRSGLALDLAGRLQAEGRGAEAVELIERLAEDLDNEARADSREVVLRARADMTLGSVLTDMNQPDRAEAALLAAVDRLEAYENSLIDRLDRESITPEERAYYERQVRATRLLRSDALTSLAVNANVRQGRYEQALAYFEAAYELNSNDFMRVLLACYRARMGALEEARALLLEIQPSPPVYYNMACTWALLGEADLAIDFLRRELDENHPSAGSRDRQRRWARDDPDLESLRGDPRFERLVAESGGE